MFTSPVAMLELPYGFRLGSFYSDRPRPQDASRSECRNPTLPAGNGPPVRVRGTRVLTSQEDSHEGQLITPTLGQRAISYPGLSMRAARARVTAPGNRGRPEVMPSALRATNTPRPPPIRATKSFVGGSGSPGAGLYLKADCEPMRTPSLPHSRVVSEPVPYPQVRALAADCPILRTFPIR